MSFGSAEQFHDTAYSEFGALAIGELLDRRNARKAVPSLDQPGEGPLFCQCSKIAGSAENFAVADRFGFLRGSMKRDVVVGVDREVVHRRFPFGGDYRVRTFITPGLGTGKQNLLVSDEILSIVRNRALDSPGRACRYRLAVASDRCPIVARTR